jgi:hypothetical protein
MPVRARRASSAEQRLGSSRKTLNRPPDLEFHAQWPAFRRISASLVNLLYKPVADESVHHRVIGKSFQGDSLLSHRFQDLMSLGSLY